MSKFNDRPQLTVVDNSKAPPPPNAPAFTLTSDSAAFPAWARLAIAAFILFAAPLLYRSLGSQGQNLGPDVPEWFLITAQVVGLIALLGSAILARVSGGLGATLFCSAGFVVSLVVIANRFLTGN